MSDVLFDIVDFAVTHLVVGGRLVFWMPTIKDKYKIEDCPSHPALTMVANAGQHFSRWTRRLLVYQRTGDTCLDVSSRAFANNGEMGHSQFSKNVRFISCSPIVLSPKPLMHYPNSQTHHPRTL